MKKVMSLVCAAVLIWNGAVWAAGSEQSAVGTNPGMVDGGYSQYSTAAMNNENYADLELGGNALRLKRRAYTLPNAQDQIIIKQYGAIEQDVRVDWLSYPVEGLYYGYDTSLDLSALPEGNHAVEIISRGKYINTIATIAFVKSSGRLAFPKNNTLSKQYNFEAIRRLESGNVPDDFAELTKLYGEGENADTLAGIRAKAEALTAGCDTEPAKVRAINRWIVENIAYDNDANGNEYYDRIEADPVGKARLDSPIRAFTQKYALCYGYARLTTLMMGYAGIDCVYITGRLSGTSTGDINREIDAPETLEKMNHAWNAVKIDGSWCFVDTSQDALGFYFRREKSQPETGYVEISRDPIYVHMLASLNELSKTHIGLRIGVKNYGAKLTATAVPDGWQQAGSATTFYVDGVKPKDTWKTIDGNRYHFDGSGAVRKGWQLVDGYWRYFGEQGILATGEQKIKDGTQEVIYTFDGSGCLTANNTWVSWGGGLRFYRGREMLRGWQYLEDHWRYFDDDGVLYRNGKIPLELDGREYAVTDEGILGIEGSGWVILGEERIYLDEARVRTGMQDIGGKSYLFDSRGVMQTGWKSEDGRNYYFGQEGAMQTGWIYTDENWYYCDRQQGRYTGVQTVSGNTYYFTAQGILSAGGWVELGDARLYYVDGKKKDGVYRGGRLMRGWKIIDKALYFFDKEDGRMHTGPKEMYNENNQKWYIIDENGAATKMEV